MGGKSLCEGSSPFIKEISTIKVRYAKISIPGHATAHASGLFRTQRAPAPYTELARRGRGQRRQSRHDVEYLRDSVQKHVITLTYMRNVHDGYVSDACLPKPILRFSPPPCSFDSDTSSPPLSPFRTRRSHWCHMIMMSHAELDRVFNNTATKKRCVNLFPFSRRNGCNVSYRTRFATLAMSLSLLFEITQQTDCLHATLNMLTDY